MQHSMMQWNRIWCMVVHRFKSRRGWTLCGETGVPCPRTWATLPSGRSCLQSPRRMSSPPYMTTSARYLSFPQPPTALRVAITVHATSTPNKLQTGVWQVSAPTLGMACTALLIAQALHCTSTDSLLHLLYCWQWPKTSQSRRHPSTDTCSRSTHAASLSAFIGT